MISKDKEVVRDRGRYVNLGRIAAPIAEPCGGLMVQANPVKAAKVCAGSHGF